MDMEVFTVAGWQYGKFEIKDGKDAGLMKPYANIFVMQDMIGVPNDNYQFCGAKAVKKKVIDPSLLSKVQPGDKVHLYFDSIVIDHQIYDRSVYAAAVAQSKHEYAQTSKGRPIKLGNDYLYAQFLRDKIVSEKFSPYSALVAARSAGFNTSVCVCTLYSYIYKGYLLDVSKKHLIYKSAPKSKEPPVKRILHPQFPSIDHRPQHINTRQELGHWEMDCVCGEQGTLSALLVFTERVTRYELIFKIPNKTTSSVVNVLDGLERRYPDFNELFRSITCDNGSEFMDYPGMVRSVYGGKRTEVYYCHPYCSSERGSNENCNRIIRRWIPKGQDIGQYSEGYIQKVQDWINYYPRRLHGHFSAAACADVWLSA